MTVIVGIDPGLSGAIAVLDFRSELEWVVDMPVMEIQVGSKKKNTVNAHHLALTFQHIVERDDVVLCVIEDVHSSPQMGVASSFGFGRSKGVLEGAVAAHRWRCELAPPATWKKALKLGKGKDEAREVATNLWPDHAEKFARVKDDGRAEACLLAEHGRRLLLEQGVIPRG